MSHTRGAAELTDPTRTVPQSGSERISTHALAGPARCSFATRLITFSHSYQVRRRGVVYAGFGGFGRRIIVGEYRGAKCWRVSI